MNVKHGYTKNGIIKPTYQSWCSMLHRCRNPKNVDYPRYGGRGITVTKHWYKFENFLVDMGERPNGTTLGRINNDGPYEKSNCRWETSDQQNSNRSDLHWITANGVTRTIEQWAQVTGIAARTISARINDLGWTEERAVTTPLMSNKESAKSRERQLQINGVTKAVSEWADTVGLSKKTIFNRLALGWTPKRAVFERKRQW